MVIRFHVIGVDIRHHRDDRRQVQERRVRLIGFGDEKIAGAESRARACRQKSSANHERRIESAFRKYRRNQARRRRFSMGTGDGDPLLQTHELSEHQRARHDGNGAFACRLHFRIVLRNRRRNDDGIDTCDVLRVMADGNRDAETREPARD